MSNTIEVIKVRRKSENKELARSTPNSCPEREQCREFLLALVRGIVDQPESVVVNYVVGDRTTVFKVDCQQQSLGQIIGSKGKNITGIRAVISATMARKGIRAIVEIPYFAVGTDAPKTLTAA